MTYYRSLKTGCIISSANLNTIDDILGFGSADSLICNHILEPYKPTVIEFLERDERIKAIMFYRNIHGCSITKARDMVTLIEKDMKKFRKG